jgi:anti-anti-sigma regulatory factor
MLRINQRPCECGERLELEGRLTTDYVPELAKVVAEARRRASLLTLDLSELTFLDAQGARFLRGLEADGIQIRGCSGFVAELLGLR